MMPAALEVYPREFRINDRLLLLVGFQDCRVKVRWNTKIPIVGWAELLLFPVDRPNIHKVVVAQREHKKMAAEGKRLAVPLSLKVSPKVTGRVGFPDDHVEIVVALGPLRYTIPITDDEAPKVEAALAFSDEWDAKAQIERTLKGAKA